MQSAIHFIGFKDDRIFAAMRVWGRPDFWHRKWAARAQAEIFEGDKAIFATGNEHQPIKPWTWDDSSRF